MNIADRIREETATLRDHVAVVEGDDRFTYGDLAAAVDGFAARLRALGVQPRQRVAFLCDDGIDYIAASLALLSLGGVVVPVPPATPDEETASLVEDIDVHGFLHDPTLHEGGGGQRLDAPSGRRELCFQPRHARDDVPEIYYRLNPAFIRFSSGTTGASKGVLLSHEAIVERTSAADRGLGMTSGDVVLWVLSMSFHFVVTILLFLRRGATLVMCTQQFPQSLLDGVERHRGTFIYASPFHYHALAGSDLFRPESLARIRLAISTAMKLPADTAEAFARKFGFPLSEAYGIIEVGLPFVNGGPDRKPGSVGRILPDYALRIAHPDGEGVGEVLIRGKGMFDAYFSPWQTREEAFPDGWFRTGDIGRVDADGYLFIVGRTKHVINFAGMKVFPYEVEDVLNRHPAIRESLVYGVAHPQYGQLPCARLVLRAGASAPDITELRRFCYARLAPYKVPKEFAVVERLERTASGKLRRA